MRRRRFEWTGVLLATGVCGWFLAPSLAGNATITCTTPNNTMPQFVKVTITYPGGASYVINAIIQPGDTATQKRDKISAAIDAHAVPNFDVENAASEPKVTIKNLPAGATVEFAPQKTGEVADKITVVATPAGQVNYTGIFEPFDYVGQPAIFTAGIVTDVGELSAAVSSAELSFQTDGPIICQALFQRLAPRAPQYGAQINYAGDRLEVYFDPAYTVTQGGIIFGTSSTSEGSGGSTLIPADPPPNPCPGDTNGDRQVDNADLQDILDGWASMIGDPNYNPGADLNHDGVIDNFDLQEVLDNWAHSCPP